MLKLLPIKSIIILVAFTHVISVYESECVTCTFTFRRGNYGCQLDNQTVESETNLTTVDGAHEIDHTDQNVTWISSNNSRISFFPSLLIEHFPQLIEAIFDESQMTSFGQPISCGELDFVELNGNLLSSIPDRIFAHCSHLKRLALSGNNLETIGEFTFAGLTDLVFLDLERNNLSSIHPKSFGSLVNLGGIYLGSNKLETLDPTLFLNCVKLSDITLNDNRITSLSDDFLINSQPMFDIDFSQNRINSIGPKLFGVRFRLSGSLNLSYNLIEELPVFDNVTLLSKLHLNNNRIRKISTNTFSNLRRLFLLQLNDNQIVDLEGGAFPEYSDLWYLYLNSNSITNLPANSFSRTNLAELWLSDNQITHLHASSFEQMQYLHRLHVERNRIESVDRKLFAETPLLGTLNLSGNICANESFSKDDDWPTIGTCSSVKIQANVAAILMVVLLIKNVI